METAAAFESVWDRTISELAELVGEVDRREIFRIDQHASVKGWCRALGRWSDGEARARARTARLSQAMPAVAVPAPAACRCRDRP